jgi:NitT/TauT family transport system permease protein
MVKKEHLAVLIQRSLAIIIFLLLWEIMVRTGLTYPSPLPPVSGIFYGLKDLVLKRFFWECFTISMLRICSGYVLAGMVAIPLGFAMGWFITVDRYLDPLLQTLRQIPLPVMFPIFIIFFGDGEISMILIIMLSAMWWILINTICAVQNVDPFLVKMARSVGASKLDVLREVVLPSAIPSIFTGLRYAYTDVILITITVEMLSAETGLGIFMISHQYHGKGHVLMYTIVLLMTMIGLTANYILVAFEKRLCRWREEIVS